MTLIERLEKLTGPCRKCDAAIHALVSPHEFDDDAEHYATFPIMNRADLTYLQSIGVRNYTASLDAAMTLVPEGYDKWAVSGRNAATVNERHAVVQWSYAATPAIALCIAALKARQ